jgi:hypothetical protein
LADQTDASTADVTEWRDEALLLNLAFLGPAEHELLAQAGYGGVETLAAAPWEQFEAGVRATAQTLGLPLPDPLSLRSWWEQGQVLADA